MSFQRYIQQNYHSDTMPKEKIDLDIIDMESGKKSQLSPSSGNLIIKQEPAGISRNLKLLGCFLGLQVSYILWGITQENLMTKEYRMGRFKSSAFCVFANRALALLVALVIVLVRKYTNGSTKEAPFYSYAPSSLSNSLSAWAQYEALKHVSFPLQVLSKSCKLIPVMLVGIALNKKSYPMIEYLEAVAITAGVTLFTLTEKASKSTNESGDSMFGVFLLCTYLICDSFTSQWQSRVYKNHGVDQFQMMLGVNVWSIILTGFTLWQSSEFISSIAFIMNDSDAFVNMLVLSITSASGQLVIYYTIKEFGPVIFTIMMTVRQILSLLISCGLNHHSLQMYSWIAVAFVFLVVFRRIYRKGSD